jgi:hypothetical protein
MDALEENGARAFTFDEVVKGVAKRLETEIRETLNDLSDKQRIQRHVGGQGHPWRYQARPTYRRI